jgi:hypothetical protein
MPIVVSLTSSFREFQKVIEITLSRLRLLHSGGLADNVTNALFEND